MTELKCDECDFVAPTFEEWHRHEKRHWFEFIVRCRRCDYVTDSKANLKEHKAKEHNAKEQWPQCPICGVTKLARYMREHVRNVHSNEKSSLPADENFQCHLCPEEFRVRADLYRHLIEHRREVADRHAKAGADIPSSSGSNKRTGDTVKLTIGSTQPLAAPEHVRTVHANKNGSLPADDERALQNEENGSECNLVPEMFPSRVDLKRHIGTHRREDAVLWAKAGHDNGSSSNGNDRTRITVKSTTASARPVSCGTNISTTVEKTFGADAQLPTADSQLACQGSQNSSGNVPPRRCVLHPARNSGKSCCGSARGTSEVAKLPAILRGNRDVHWSQNTGLDDRAAQMINRRSLLRRNAHLVIGNAPVASGTTQATNQKTSTSALPTPGLSHPSSFLLGKCDEPGGSAPMTSRNAVLHGESLLLVGGRLVTASSRAGTINQGIHATSTSSLHVGAAPPNWARLDGGSAETIDNVQLSPESGRVNKEGQRLNVAVPTSSTNPTVSGGHQPVQQGSEFSVQIFQPGARTANIVESVNSTSTIPLSVSGNGSSCHEPAQPVKDDCEQATVSNSSAAGNATTATRSAPKAGSQESRGTATVLVQVPKWMVPFVKAPVLFYKGPSQMK